MIAPVLMLIALGFAACRKEHVTIIEPDNGSADDRSHYTAPLKKWTSYERIEQGVKRYEKENG